MKKLIIVLISVLSFMGCKNHKDREFKTPFETDNASASAQIFAPGIISAGLNERDLTISPEFDEFFYCILEEPHYTIMHVRKNKSGKWQEPVIASFSGRYDDCEPMFSPDGSRLYFCSNRPDNDSKIEKDYDIWYVDKTSEGWGKPVNIGLPVNTGKNEFYPSITKNNTLYFTSSSMKIMKAEFYLGRYLEPEAVPDSVNSCIAGYNAIVSPDESFLIYTSHGWPDEMGKGDLYISYRKRDGMWTKPKNLGDKVNSDATEMSPCLSPDGKFLIFSSDRVLNLNDQEINKTFDDIHKNALHYDNGRFNIYWVNLNEII